MTILFLEDDDAIARAVCDFLAGRGCRVARYTTLAAARQALAYALGARRVLAGDLTHLLKDDSLR